MPHEQMDVRQVADYLHMDAREVTKLASRGQIPCRKVRGDFVFHKGQVDHWIESQMHELDAGRLASIEKGVSAHHGFDHEETLVCPLIPRDPGGIAVPLQAKTGGAAIRALLALAEKSHLVYNRAELMDEILKREDMCPTAFIPGVALPHPRHPLPYDIATSFAVIGLTAGGIPFGAPHGGLTRLFIMICCKDDRTHLHVLARIARMLDDHDALEEMMHAETAGQLRGLLEAREACVLGED